MSAFRTPNFFVAGTQKAGTSYLCAELAEHSQIFFSRVKEPMFFSRGDVTASSYQEYLAEHFAEAAGERWAGEGSTLYFQSERAIANLVKFIGRDLKFIVCLRQPTEKAVSLYMHNFRRGRLRGSERITELEGTPFAVRPQSLYRDWCDRYAQTFGRKQIVFALYDQLVDDPAGFVGIALQHLGLDAESSPKPGLVNRGLPLVWDGDILKPDPATTPLQPDQTLPEFTRDELLTLHNSFLDDVRRTQDFIAKDLAAWLEFPAFQEERVDEMKRKQALAAMARAGQG